MDIIPDRWSNSANIYEAYAVRSRREISKDKELLSKARYLVNNALAKPNIRPRKPEE
jgi:hypothetical protein